MLRMLERYYAHPSSGAEMPRPVRGDGPDGLGVLFPTRRPFGRLANDALGILGFVLADRGCDSADIEVVRLAEVLADSMQLLNDWVSPLHVELRNASSSGVQMIGGQR